MPLSETEKVDIRHHLGFSSLPSSTTFALGVPAAVETSWAIERAMNLVTEAMLPKTRDIICILNKIEAQKVGDLELLAVDVLGEITLRKEEQKQLDREYKRWQGALANMLLNYVNPFDKRGGSGANVSVS